MQILSIKTNENQSNYSNDYLAKIIIIITKIEILSKQSAQQLYNSLKNQHNKVEARNI